MDLSEFLLARIADDEDTAKRAAFGYGARWTSESDDAEDWSVVHADGKRDMVGCEDGDVTRHIARHDPARVLAECEAKRRIVEAAWADHLQIEGEWGRSRSREGLSARNDYPEVVRLLAAPYADHPDYNPEWKRGARGTAR